MAAGVWAGAVAVSSVPLTYWTEVALVEPKATVEAGVKSVPVMVTLAH